MRALLAALALTATSALAERPRLVLLSLTGVGVDPAQLESVTQRVAAGLAARNVFEVISTADVSTLLGLERQKQLLGCGESSCLTELTGALGARFVMSGTLVRLGDTFQLTLTTLDGQRAQPVGRAVRLGPSLDAVLAGLPWAIAESAGLPAPEEPSKAVPIVLLSVGGAALVGGGIVGLQGMLQEAALQGELSRSRTLDRLADYRQRAEQPALLKTISLATMVGGAALATLGVVLWPRGVAGTGVALVPAPGGLAFAGVLP